MSKDVKIALISAGAGVLVATIGAFAVIKSSSHEESKAKEPLSLSLNVDERFTSPSVLRGHVGHLEAGTSVWTFNEPFGTDQAAPSGVLYVNPGPCPVDSNGDWACGSTYLGQGNVDKGKRFRVFVSVVPDSVAHDLVSKALVNTYRGGPVLGGSTVPPSLPNLVPAQQDVVLVGFG